MDLLISSTGDLVYSNTSVTTTASITDDVAQRLKIKLQTYLGEWFLDTSVGIPYYSQVFGKGKKKDTIDSIIQSAILAEDGVAKIVTFNSSISDRLYSATFVVLSTEGQTTNPITAGA